MPTCAVCGREFIPTCNANKKYCSFECKLKGKYARERDLRTAERLKVPGTCHICGRKFKREYLGQKYCSDDCRNSPQAVRLRKFFTMLINYARKEVNKNAKRLSQDTRF